jgi:hypothetical protein
MSTFTNFINTITYQTNPNQNLDRTLPTSIALPDVPGTSADPNTGLSIFLNTPFDNGGKTCATCHPTDPGTGTNLKVLPSGTGTSPVVQPMKVPHLRNLYQKTNVNLNKGGISVNGFGFNHDGQITGLFAQVGQNSFPLFTNNTADKEAIEAFELCFDTGTAPAVGYARTLTAATVTSSPAQSDWSTLQSQAAAANIDLIAQGTIQGQIHGLLYLPATNKYQSDTTGLGPFTQAQLVSFIQSGDTLTIMGVPAGSGTRMAIDRNLDGVKNGDEARKLNAMRGPKGH